MTDKHLTIPEWPHDLTDEIRTELVGSRRTLVALDDDPTGTQTVHDVPVLTVYDLESLTEVIEDIQPPLLFILTNSRSLAEYQTQEMHATIAERLNVVAQTTGQQIELISRSDSTLRGHFPLETDTIADVWPEQADLTLVMPFFKEGGRLTVDGQHYVCEGKQLLKAHETPFAKDRVFGYQHSYMPDWVEEKTRGRVKADKVVLIPLEVIRKEGPDAVEKILDDAPRGAVCVADAAADSDAAVVAAAVGKSSRRIMARVAASYVRARAGLVQRPLLTPKQLAGESGAGGLIMVGSHVPKTTAQLEHLKQRFPELLTIELDISEILADSTLVVKRTVAKLNESLAADQDTVVYTGRKTIAGANDDETLRISNVVSKCVSDVVAGLKVRPRYLLAKGGVTSSDIATKSLGVTLATVEGSILPGVPVWRLGEESKFPGMHYVIFPGNVGEDSAVGDAVAKLNGVDP